MAARPGRATSQGGSDVAGSVHLTTPVPTAPHTVADEAAEGRRRSAEPSPQPPARMEDGEEQQGAAAGSSAASSVSGAGLEDGEGTTTQEDAGGKPAGNGRGGGRGGPSLERGAYQHQHSTVSTDGGGNGHAAPGAGGVGAGMEPTSAIKLLVSAQLAGCLIGKGGATINELQERTGARIKLSQNNDFFPGACFRGVDSDD